MISMGWAIWRLKNFSQRFWKGRRRGPLARAGEVSGNGCCLVFSFVFSLGLSASVLACNEREERQSVRGMRHSTASRLTRRVASPFYHLEEHVVLRRTHFSQKRTQGGD